MCDDESIVEIVNYATLIRTKILFQSTVGVACLQSTEGLLQRHEEYWTGTCPLYNLKKTWSDTYLVWTAQLLPEQD